MFLRKCKEKQFFCGSSISTNCVGYNKLPFHEPNMVDCTGLCVCVCVCCVYKGVQLWYELQHTWTWRAVARPWGKAKRFKSSFMTTPDRRPVCVQRRQLQQWGGLFPHHPLFSHDFGLPTTSIFLASWRLHSEDSVLRERTSWNTAFVMNSDASTKSYATGIQRSMHKWRNCVDNKGYFMEK